jgi:hypothetical protein
MHLNSQTKIALVIVLSASMLAIGCSAQWISVALADLPVLTQMALNIAALVATLQSGKAAQPDGGVGHPEHLSRGQQRPDPAADVLQRLQSESEHGHDAEDPERDCRHQSEFTRPVTGRAYQRSDPGGQSYGGSQFDSDHSKQFRIADTADCSAIHSAENSTKRHHPESQRFEKAVEPAGVRAHGEIWT